MLTKIVEMMAEDWESLANRTGGMAVSLEILANLASGDDRLEKTLIAAFLSADELPKFVYDKEITPGEKEIGELLGNAIQNRGGVIAYYLVAAAVDRVDLLTRKAEYSAEEVVRARQLLSQAGITDELGNLSPRAAKIIREQINAKLAEPHIFSADQR